MQFGAEQLLWVLLGMMIMIVWRDIYDHSQSKKADAQSQEVQLYNVYTDHGIYDRLLTDEQTNRPIYPNFREWDGGWFKVSEYRESRWYVTDTFGRESVHRKPAIKAVPFRDY